MAETSNILMSRPETIGEGSFDPANIPEGYLLADDGVTAKADRNWAETLPELGTAPEGEAGATSLLEPEAPEAQEPPALSLRQISQTPPAIAEAGRVSTPEMAVAVMDGANQTKRPEPAPGSPVDPVGGQVSQEDATLYQSTVVHAGMTEAGIQDPNIAVEIDAPMLPEDHEMNLEDVYLEVLDYDPDLPIEEQPGFAFNFYSQIVYDWLHKRGKTEHRQDGVTRVPPAVGNLATTSGNPDDPLPKMGVARQAYSLFASQIAASAETKRLDAAAVVKGADISKFGLEWAAQLMYSDIGMLRGYLQAEDIPKDVAMAQASLLDMYHELGDFTGRGTVRFLKNLAVNPSTYFGLGSMGVVKNLLAQGGGKAVRQSMSRRLMRTALGSSILGAEAGAYGLGADYILQVLEHGGIDEPFVWDTNRSLMAAGIGFVGGTALTAVAGPAVRSAGNLIKKIQGGTASAGLGIEDVTPGGVETVLQSPVAKERSALRGRSLEDLEENIPIEVRTVKPITPGPKTTVDGKPFLTLDLKTPGRGANFDQKQLDQMWNEALDETGPVARDVLAELAADGKTMTPRELAFWNKGLKLPNRSRYWYEISAEDFRARFPDLTDDELSRMIDVVAATSPQADPHQNIRRAVGALSQDLRGQPIDVDIVSPASVQQALSDAKLEGLKTGSFSGTFQYHLGLEDVPPLSTNDRQVASSFGIDGEDIAGNEVLYEVLSRFYVKMRDQLNDGVPAGAEPYETWQLQALGWVQERIGKGNPKNDDYVQALDQLVVDMNKAGIELPDGKFTREVLLDPRLEQVVSGTLERFRSSPIATVETVTTQTDVGARTAALADQAAEVGDTVVVKAHQRLVQRSLKRLITRRPDLGKKSVVDVVVRAATGKNPGLTRMEVGQGTFEGVLSQNARIPLPPDMTPTQIRGVLAVLGRTLKQDAVPASVFKHVKFGDEVAEGSTGTHSIFIRDVEGGVSDEQILALQQALPAGHDVNVKKVANGVLIDVNPKFADDGSAVGITMDEAGAALDAVGFDKNKDQIIVSPRHFSGEYLETSGYNSAISELRREILDELAAKLAKEFKGDEREARRALKGNADLAGVPRARQERIRKARDRYLGRISDISRSDTEARKVAGELEVDSKKFNKRFGERLMPENTD